METEKKRILLIEDDNTYRRAIYEKLSDEGYYVVMQPHTLGAKDWAVSKEIRPFDMIISDQKMPGEEGSAFLSFLNELQNANLAQLNGNSEISQKLRKRFPGIGDGDFRSLIEKMKASSCIRVILSGYAEDERISRALEKRIIHKFLSKNQGLDDILAAISALFSEQEKLVSR